jgi:signal transduction histidine kinase
VIPQLSVRARLTAWNVGIVALVLVLSGVAVRYLLQASLMDAVEEDLARTGARFADAYRRFPFPQTKPAPRPEGQKVQAPASQSGPGAPAPAGRPNLLRISQPDLRPRVLDQNGEDHRPEGTIGPWDAQTFSRSLSGERRFSTIAAEGQELRVYSLPAFRDGKIQAVIQLVDPLAPTRRALDQLSKTLLVLVPVGLLLAALGGSFLTGRALRPVREVADAASEIQAESLSARLPVRGKDEFSHLASILNGMLARLEAAFERQKRFTGDASHELRTPLATIKATSSLAREDEWDAAACHTALLNIERAADRAERIVEDLLLLARADSQRLASRDAGPAVLPDVIQRALEATRVSGDTGRPPVRVQLPPNEALAVAVEPGHLMRVFVNLLENADRHTPADGEILITARPAGEVVEVSVRDSGEGIAPEHLPHLTERFYRVDAARSRARGGAGLGLAICRSIVEAHGGRLEIASDLGRGTEVRVALPRAAGVAGGTDVSTR